MLLCIAPLHAYIIGRYVNTTGRWIAFSIIYIPLLFTALWVLIRKKTSYVAPLRVLHIGHFLGILVASGNSISISNPNFWWLSVAPFVALLSGLTVLGLVEGFVVACFAVTAYYNPQLHVPSADEYLRVHLAAVLSTSYAILYLTLATLWRKKLQVALDNAQNTAARATQAKAQFLANMSHEIRTPLFGVIGAIELMRSPNLLDAQRTQLLSMQEQSAKSLLTILNDILDWSKIEAGKVELNTDTFDLRAVVAESTQLFAIQAFNKNIEITASADPDVPREIIGDSLRLRQILNNLASNAIKFTQRGGVHVHLALQQEEDAQAPGGADRPIWVRIDVADTGIGIPGARLPTLFNPFTQADTSIARRYGGTGLGLSISRELVNLLGGKIVVRSAVGHGSTFSVLLPLGRTLEPDMRESRSTTEALLVCDNPGLIRHMLTLFHDLQVNAQVVAEVPQLTEKTPKLVFIDAALLTNQTEASAWLTGMKSANVKVGMLAPLTAQSRATENTEGVLYKPVSSRALEDFIIYKDTKQRAAYNSRQQELVISGTRILIVEDNTINQIIVQKMIEALGAQWTAANTGYEALEHLKNTTFDAVLMDIELPEIDGIQATRRWRELESRTRRKDGRGLPIIAMAAQVEADIGALCTAAGMDHYIAKPFSINQLKTVLANALRNGPRAV